MIAAHPLIDLWGAAKFAGDKHGGALQQAFFLQCPVEAAQTGIKRGQVAILETAPVILVGVPSPEVEGDKFHTAFHKARGEQAALGEGLVIEHAGDTSALFGKIEGLARLGAAHHLVGLGAEFIHAREDLVVLSKATKGLIVLGHHVVAAIHVIKRDAAQGEATHLHGLASRRRATGLKRTVFHAEKPSGIIALIGHSHKRGQFLGALHFLAHHRAVAGVPEAGQGTVASHQILSAERVCGQGVAHATQDSELVGHLGELGQVFAEPHAGHFGFDLLELAAMRIRRVWLEIKGIHVGRPAAQSNEDGCLALGLGVEIAFLGLG